MCVCKHMKSDVSNVALWSSSAGHCDVDHFCQYQSERGAASIPANVWPMSPPPALPGAYSQSIQRAMLGGDESG